MPASDYDERRTAFEIITDRLLMSVLRSDPEIINRMADGLSTETVDRFRTSMEQVRSDLVSEGWMGDPGEYAQWRTGYDALVASELENLKPTISEFAKNWGVREPDGPDVERARVAEAIEHEESWMDAMGLESARRAQEKREIDRSDDMDFDR